MITGIVAISIVFCAPVVVPEDEETVPESMALIFGGEFEMGSSNRPSEQPIHTVHLDAFYLDQHEVTNAQYKAFVLANPDWQKERIDARFHEGTYLEDWDGNNYPDDKEDHPITWVSWHTAADRGRVGICSTRWIGKSKLPVGQFN